MGMPTAREIESGRTVVRRAHVVAERLEEHPEAGRRIDIVVGDQHSRERGLAVYTALLPNSANTTAKISPTTNRIQAICVATPAIP